MHPSFPFGSVRIASFLLGAGVLFSLAGCYTSPPPSAYNSRGRSVEVVDADDYVYYPGYEVYYNNRRRQYVYRDNNAWVTRGEPPRAWARDLRTAPSVHVDFHDAPERHHADIVKSYPKTWKPQPRPQPHADDRHDKDDRRDRDDRR